VSVRPGSKPVREPKPLKAFFLSLAVSAVLLGALLTTDRRVLELRQAKADVKELDRKIAEERKEKVRLTSAIDAANREEFPAEKVAREELNLVHPEDLVLLYPPGSLSADRKATPTPTRGPRRSPTP
jgi:septal ring factor EnvC (AmiA/AmiB activator)